VNILACTGFKGQRVASDERWATGSEQRVTSLELNTEPQT